MHLSQSRQLIQDVDIFLQGGLGFGDSPDFLLLNDAHIALEPSGTVASPRLATANTKPGGISEEGNLLDGSKEVAAMNIGKDTMKWHARSHGSPFSHLFAPRSTSFAC